MRNERVKHLLIGLLVLTAGLLAVCRMASNVQRHSSNVQERSIEADGVSQPTRVEVFEVKPCEATGEQLIPAVLSVKSKVELVAKRDGVLEWVCCQEGATVSRNQVIAHLSDDESRAEFRQAEVEVSRMKVEEQQSESLVKLNASDLERQDKLFRSGLISRRELDQAQYKLLSAKQELEKVRFGTQIAQARIEAAKAHLEKSDICAPFTGIITYRNGDAGAGVVRGEKLFEISEVSSLEVKFQMPHADRKLLDIGNMVDIALADGNHVVAQARVQRIDPVIDPSTNSLGYLADVLGGEGLIPGMAVYIRIPKRAAGTTLYLPRAAFRADADLYQGATAEVFILDGDRCASRAVWISTIAGDQVEIKSGLVVGDHVIMAPPAELNDGDRVVM